MEWIFWTALAVSLIFHSEVSDLINALAEWARSELVRPGESIKTAERRIDRYVQTRH